MQTHRLLEAWYAINAQALQLHLVDPDLFTQADEVDDLVQVVSGEYEAGPEDTRIAARTPPAGQFRNPFKDSIEKRAIGAGRLRKAWRIRPIHADI